MNSDVVTKVSNLLSNMSTEKMDTLRAQVEAYKQAERDFAAKCEEARKPLIKIIDEVVPAKTNSSNQRAYRCPWDVAKFLYPALKPFIGWSVEGRKSDSDLFGEAPLFVSLLGEHMASYKGWLFAWAEKARARMLKEVSPLKASIYAGDLDVHLQMIVDNKKKTVFHVRNSCSCADIVDWLVVWDHDEGAEEIHVRQVWTTGHDYKKNNQFTQRGNLKFWKDRGYVVDYVEKHHMSRLGGVYGDIRDSGYIASFKRYTGELAGLSESMEDGPDRLGHFYNDWKHAIYNLDWIASEFDSEPETS